MLCLSAQLLTIPSYAVYYPFEGDYTAMTNLALDRPPAYTTRTSPFLDQVRQVLRLKRMSRRNEASYLHYIVDYMRFQGKRHP